jgi:hypothetical protein
VYSVAAKGATATRGTTSGGIKAAVDTSTDRENDQVHLKNTISREQAAFSFLALVNTVHTSTLPDN